MATKRKKVWHRNSHCGLLRFSLTLCDTSFCNKFWHVMKNLSSQAHPGTIPHSPPSGKINLFAYKIFIFNCYSQFQIQNIRTLICLEGKEKRSNFSHPDTTLWVFLSWIEFQKGLFFQFLRIFYYGQKGRNFSKKPGDHITQICS